MRTHQVCLLVHSKSSCEQFWRGFFNLSGRKLQILSSKGNDLIVRESKNSTHLNALKIISLMTVIIPLIAAFWFLIDYCRYKNLQVKILNEVTPLIAVSNSKTISYEELKAFLKKGVEISKTSFPSLEVVEVDLSKISILDIPFLEQLKYQMAYKGALSEDIIKEYIENNHLIYIINSFQNYPPALFSMIRALQHTGNWNSPLYKDILAYLMKHYSTFNDEQKWDFFAALRIYLDDSRSDFIQPYLEVFLNELFLNGMDSNLLNIMLSFRPAETLTYLETFFSKHPDLIEEVYVGLRLEFSQIDTEDMQKALALAIEAYLLNSSFKEKATIGEKAEFVTELLKTYNIDKVFDHMNGTWKRPSFFYNLEMNVRLAELIFLPEVPSDVRLRFISKYCSTPLGKGILAQLTKERYLELNKECIEAKEPLFNEWNLLNIDKTKRAYLILLLAMQNTYNIHTPFSEIERGLEVLKVSIDQDIYRELNLSVLDPRFFYLMKGLYNSYDDHPLKNMRFNLKDLKPSLVNDFQFDFARYFALWLPLKALLILCDDLNPKDGYQIEHLLCFLKTILSKRDQNTIEACLQKFYKNHLIGLYSYPSGPNGLTLFLSLINTPEKLRYALNALDSIEDGDKKILLIHLYEGVCFHDKIRGKKIWYKIDLTQETIDKIFQEKGYDLQFIKKT